MSQRICDQVRETINGEYRTSIGPDQADLPLTEAAELNYDSLRVMEVVSLIEETFSIEIDFAADDVQETFRSVTSIARLLERKAQDRAVLDNL